MGNPNDSPPSVAEAKGSLGARERTERRVHRRAAVIVLDLGCTHE